MKVRRGRGLGEGRLVADQDFHGNVVALGVNHAAFSEQHEPAQAAAAVEHLEGSTRFLDGRDEKVLQNAARFKVSGHLRNLKQVIGPLADIDRRKREFRKLDGSGHWKSSIWRPDQPGH